MAGIYVLQTDARGADKGGPAAIGVVLRQRQKGRLVVVDFISRRIPPASIGAAEYEALLAGLKLARHHGAKTLRVYVDSRFVADQVNDPAPKFKADFRQEHAAARALMKGIDIRVSWVPREMNTEADQRVNDALLH